MLIYVSLAVALASSVLMFFGCDAGYIGLGVTLASFVGQGFTTKEEISMTNDNRATGKGVLNGAVFTPIALGKH